MNYIEFAENERLSTIVLGMMRISQMSEDEVEALVEAALSIGNNTFDLADIYGDGQCEILLGKVLKRRPDLRDQMWIQSKCGIRKDGFTYFDFSKDYILDSINGILERLQIERLDSLLLHRPDALMEPEEVAEAFNHLEQAGKVRFLDSIPCNEASIRKRNHFIQFPWYSRDLRWFRWCSSFQTEL